MNINSQLKTLREVIAKEVFIREGQERFVSKKGMQTKWIFDFRKIILKPQYLNIFADIFWETYKDKYPFQVGGLEVAAIPLISAIVMKSVEKGKPVNGFFIRKSRKKDGLMRMIEGEIMDAPIILVDDIINTGFTFTRQLAVLENLNKNISDIFVILRFRENDYYDFANKKIIKITSLFTLQDFNIIYLSKNNENKPQYNPFEIKWHFKSENPNYFYVVPKSAPVLDENKIYLGSDNGYFWALNQENGETAWKYKVGFHPKGKAIFSTPAIHEGIVYFGSYDGNVYALDTQTGKRKWVFFEADWVGSSPAIAPDLGLLFIGLEFGLLKKKGGIAALDLKTGKKKWEYDEMPELTHCSPAYNEKKKVVAIGSNNSVAYLFNAKNGKLLWKYQADGEIKSAPTFDLKRDYVIVPSLDGNLYILDIESGKLINKFQAEFGFYSIPLVNENFVYAASLDKKLYCINLDTFSLEWEFMASSRIFASPIIINENIYIGANDGRLYEINADTGKLISFFQVTERITNKIAYNPQTKRFFLPTYANEIYCLEKQ